MIKMDNNPLKLKYRTAQQTRKVVKSKSGGSGNAGAKSKKKTLIPRRRAWGPF